MADLIFFPQLSSGALAQYPIRKRTSIRTVKNLLADGSMLVAADPGASQLFWTLNYVDLSAIDMQALLGHFDACRGSLRAFTFLDPTDNLLSNSANLTQASWVIPAGITIETGLPDPAGGTTAFQLTNASAATEQVSQTLAVPVSFQYCFSVYALAPTSGECVLTSASANAQQSNVCQVGTTWSRISSSGALQDSGLGLTVGISLAPGQSLSIFGPQLEPQFTPSRFRPTYSNAGVYANAHWASSELIFTADGPNLFSTSFNIETNV